jgi:hypothetical protein
MPLFLDGAVSMTKGFSNHVNVSFMLISVATVLGSLRLASMPRANLN